MRHKLRSQVPKENCYSKIEISLYGKTDVILKTPKFILIRVNTAETEHRTKCSRNAQFSRKNNATFQKPKTYVTDGVTKCNC